MSKPDVMRLPLAWCRGMTTEAREDPVAVVNEQAEDSGLWFVAESVTEDYLQRALRRLHAAVEGKSAAACATEVLRHDD